MKTTKSGRKFCAILPLRVFAGVLLALCAAFIFATCKNPMIDEFLGYPKFVVTAPMFSDAGAGYIPVAKRIVIQNNGKIAGTVKNIVVSPDTAFTIIPGTSRTVGSGKNISSYMVEPKAGLADGAYEATIIVTYKSTDTSAVTASAPVAFYVTSSATRSLTVTAPIFSPVTAGYTQPAARDIVITNTGNTAATISSVSVSDTARFAISGSGTTVAAADSINGWKVRPAAALGVGVYGATITVTYDGGARAYAPVAFEVTATGTAALSVTVPTFADAYTGYNRPAAQSIIITNTGNAAATITGVTINPATAIDQVDGAPFVGAGISISNWTVRPKASLSANTYSATITVTYNSGGITANASASVSFLVTTLATRNLIVTSPTFAEVTTGYTQPAAKDILIMNTGNTAATISTVSVSDTTRFAISGSGATVAADGSITGWKVRPAASLGVGVYSAMITVTYDSGAKAYAPVAFEVTAVGVPDYANASTKLTANGTWTVTANGWVRGQKVDTYASGFLSVIINGVRMGYFQLPVGGSATNMTTALYPVRTGDTVELAIGSTGTSPALVFYPMR
ncbi:MAG: hypothetical protein Ta2A_24250 [Treponemataceae bacterium]|nr:MAG: hypothetical protein Ta2A_24250 [Treponemataceae bacterium]